MKYLFITLLVLSSINVFSQFYLEQDELQIKTQLRDKGIYDYESSYTKGEITSLFWKSDKDKAIYTVFFIDKKASLYCIVPKDEVLSVWIKIYNNMFVATSDTTWTCYAQGKTVKIELKYIPDLQEYAFYHHL